MLTNCANSELSKTAKVEDLSSYPTIRKPKLIRKPKVVSVPETVSNDVKKEPYYNIEMSIDILQNNTPNYVLVACQLPSSLNITLLQELVEKYMESRKDYYKSKKRAPFVEDEFSEYWTAKVTGGAEIGGGHCGMDVKTGTCAGIDAMCVVMNSTQSNEKSLIQNFTNSGYNLDNLFLEKKDTLAVKLFIEQYSKKLDETKKKYDLNDLYILSFISTKTDIYMSCFKIDLDCIKNVTSGGFVKNSNVNITINNFIDPQYGKVNLYKSKKRLELRLLPKILHSKHCIKIYTMT